MDVSRIAITTNSAGAFSASTPRMNGYLCGIEVKVGTATTIDITLTDGEGVTLYAKTGLGTGFHVPLLQPELPDGTAMTFDGTRKLGEKMPVVGALTLAIANGGDTKTAAVNLFVDSF